MSSRALSPAEVEEALKLLPGWEYRDTWLRKTFTFASLRDAMAFVNRVADIAEIVNHHPDIYVRHRTVVLILQTHVASHQITNFDVDLANRVEALQLPGGSDAI